MGKSRKLAVILFADIEGYTKMMQLDEANARSWLDQFRNTLDAIVPSHNGRVIKYFGDGCMSMFESSVDAIRCSIELQGQFVALDVPVRVGLHSGEIFFEGGDVFGNTVNIASRIESMGQKETVLFSGKIANEIRNQKSFNYASLGEFEFKNVDNPIEIFALKHEGLSFPEIESLGTKFAKVGSKRKTNPIWYLVTFLLLTVALVALYQNLIQKNSAAETLPSDELVTRKIPSRQSLVVLPFALISQKTDQTFLSDGMMEEVLNRLFQIDGLKVISRTSSMKYKDSNKSAAEIANELDVAHVLEGSIRTDQNEIQVTMRLIHASTDSLKWMEIYNRPMTDIFALQGQIAQEVARNMKVQIDGEAQSRIQSTNTEDLEAWRLFRMARLAADNDDNMVAEQFLKEAIQIDPNFAAPYAELGFLTLLRGSYLGNAAPEEIIEMGESYLQKALNLNPNYPRTRIYLALIHLWFNWDFERAKKEWEAYYRLGPSIPFDAGYVEFLIASKRIAEAVEISEILLNEFPGEMSSWTTTGLSFYFNGEPDKAILHYQRALQLFESTSITMEAARTFLFCGRNDLVIDLLSVTNSDTSTISSRQLGMLGTAYQRSGKSIEAQKVLQVLKKRAQTTSIGSPSYYSAMILASKDEPQGALDYLKKAFDQKEVEMYWLNTEQPFDEMRNLPEFRDLISRIGFPK